MLRHTFLGVAAAALLSAAPARAHHAFSAEFDRSKPITLDGTVTRIEWTNPHAYIYLDVKDTNGKTTNWKIELGGNAELDQRAWSQRLLTTGQEITMRGWRAKTGSMLANADSVTIAGGVKLWAGSSYHLEPGQTGTVARNIREPGGVGTGGADGSNTLPQTASPVSLIGLFGALSLLSALALNRAHR